MPPDEWLAAFRRRFQSMLDHVAENRAKGYAMKAGLGTALSPVAVIDKAVVLYACVALIKELAFLYGLRPALGQSVAILARSILQTHLGGLLQDIAEAGGMIRVAGVYRSTRSSCQRRRTKTGAGRMSMPSSVRRARGSRHTTIRRPTSGCSSARLRNPRR